MRHNHRIAWIKRIKLVGLLILLGGALNLAPVKHSNAKHEQVQASPNTTFTSFCGTTTATSIQAYDWPIATAPVTATFHPSIIAVPSADGKALYIQADGISQLGGSFFANISIGPGHPKESWTMAYSDTIDAVVTTAEGFASLQSVESCMSINSPDNPQAFDTGDIRFNRVFVQASSSQPQDLFSPDGRLQLSLVSSQTVPVDKSYIIIMSSYAPPAGAPAGHSFVTTSYNVRAAGALPTSNKPMELRLSYDHTPFCGADPHTLAIFAWDATYNNKHWDNLGGSLFTEQCLLTLATSRFTIYALMTTPTWRDDFDDVSGLAEMNNVDQGPQQDTLVLASTPGSGVAVSAPISPTTAIARWGRLTLIGTAAPPTTMLRVDVLSLDGTMLLGNVADGASLGGIDPLQYPALRLRANLSSTVAGQTPALDKWQLAWDVKENRVYMPVVLK